MFARLAKSMYLCTRKTKNALLEDPLAQLVEHNTFNVGVLGSNPKRITETIIRGFFVNPLISFDTQALVFQLVGLEDFISMLNPMPNGMYREGKRPIGNHLRYKIS